MQAEWAYPELPSNINLAGVIVPSDTARTSYAGDIPVRVENSATGRFASNGFVKDRWQIFTLFERGVEGGNGDNGASGLYPGGGPDIPGKTNTCKRCQHRR